MPITISYDLVTTDNNHRSYIRSMLERFHWRRLGGSVFRYDGVEDVNGELQEDWLNHVAPALMFMRSYALNHNVTLRFFTLDAQSVAFVDHSDPGLPFGAQPVDGATVVFANPTNEQSSQERIRNFIDAGIAAT